MHTVRFFILALAVLLLSAHPVAAQISTDSDPVTINISPLYPRPYQTITITPRSSLIDLGASTVTISANGTVIQKGTGTQSAAVTAGGGGQVTKIVVTVNAPDGQTYTETLNVRPADVALIIEPATTAHAFYKGLPLPAPDGRVRLIAVPDLRTSTGAPINPATLVYRWKLGTQVLESASGIGRSVLIASAPPRYRDAEITLTVTNADSSVVAEAKTTISPVDPLVRIYSFDPLLGPDYDHAITNTYSLIGTESSFRAVPYFFATAPTIQWNVGNTPQGAQRDITVRSTGTGAGSAALEVTTKLAGTVQSASSRIVLKFGEGKSLLNIFGF